MSRRRRAALGLAAAAVVAVLVSVGVVWWSDGRTRGPGSTRDAAAGIQPVIGFGAVDFRIGGGAPHCALYARTTAERDRGLMFQKDVAGYDGMVFEWAHPTTEAFYMKNTLIALSIAWFDQSGRFVSEADMVPCPPGETCPLYSAAAPYNIAIEVPQGGLPGLGIGPGASITLAGSCH